jgi:hypothetical protein
MTNSILKWYGKMTDTKLCMALAEVNKLRARTRGHKLRDRLQEKMEAILQVQGERLTHD